VCQGILAWLNHLLVTLTDFPTGSGDIHEQAVVMREAGTLKGIIPNIYPASAAAAPYH
jgi:hypothetical protein